MNKKEISEYMRRLGKLSYKKSPRSKEYYRELQKKSIIKRKQNKKLK